jgi:RES domain-containing protein
VSILPLYRIVHRKYADDAYSGRGGLYAAGRWHSQGRLVSYASESLALATLEQVGRAGTLIRLKEMVYVRAELDAKAVYAPPAEDLPENWNQRPAGKPSQHYGDEWLMAKTSVALRVPSVILPEGFNYVLNPAHPNFAGALQIGEPRPLDLDSRISERFIERGEKT